MLGLARAKRRIQEIVTASKATQRTRNRARIARWEINNKPEEQTTTDETTLLPPFPLSDEHLGAVVDLQTDCLESEGWSAGYDLPTKNR
jgi:hypothetical protein